MYRMRITISNYQTQSSNNFAAQILTQRTDVVQGDKTYF
jgi:hypothetical protein